MFISRVVAIVTAFENRIVRLCVWNENNGPGVGQMRVPLRVDVVHNALVARVAKLRTSPWCHDFKGNDGNLAFFLDALKSGLRVGYLPSVFLHRHIVGLATCYKRAQALDYKKATVDLQCNEDLEWDLLCGDGFPSWVKEHLEAERTRTDSSTLL